MYLYMYVYIYIYICICKVAHCFLSPLLGSSARIIFCSTWPQLRPTYLNLVQLAANLAQLWPLWVAKAVSKVPFLIQGLSCVTRKGRTRMRKGAMGRHGGDLERHGGDVGQIWLSHGAETEETWGRHGETGTRQGVEGEGIPPPSVSEKQHCDGVD